MKHKYITLMICLLMGFGAHCAEMSRYELDVNDFSELKVVEGINVDYVCNPDSAGKAVFYTTPDLASVLMFTNNKNKLEMQIATDGIDYENIPTVTVYSNFLTKVENSGDSTVRVLDVAPGPRFKANLIGNGRIVVRKVNATQVDASINSGNGTIVIKGKCTVAKLSNVGVGAIEADELEAVDVKCILVGTGSVGCSVRQNLTVIGTGSGKVYHKGTPEKVTNRSLGIKIVPIGE